MFIGSPPPRGQLRRLDAPDPRQRRAHPTRPYLQRREPLASLGVSPGSHPPAGSVPCMIEPSNSGEADKLHAVRLRADLPRSWIRSGKRRPTMTPF